jgi:hypothetical protein
LAPVADRLPDATAVPMSRADARVETVNAKNGPKSWFAAMLVTKRPGTLV